ncbi:type II toxin-antitoxin system VapC family toxin [Demequina sp.]|uniref:type II toxin-antitoxin system VapC family toxin n=1 Tax=Demequina sp. TaxID=2050685 RepID=UPI003D0B25CB
MSYLLDTNVVSELRKPFARSDAHVRGWVSERHPDELYLAAMTIFQVELGIARVERRDSALGLRLRAWLEDDLIDAFAGRILPIDTAVARRAARLHVPDPRPERDALIAATALVNGLTVVTRNSGDFDPMGVAVVNPWG